MIRNCKICNKEFAIPPSALKRKGRGVFCSRSCANKELNSLRRKSLINVKCIVCNKEFNITQYRKNNGIGKFCSRSCANVILNSKRQAKLILHNCEICGTMFKANHYRTEKFNVRFCSKKCLGIWRSNNLRRENSSNWKGGINPSITSIRTSKKYQEWRQKIFIRDGFACQECAQIGGKLHAHHIKRFSYIIEEIKHNLPLLPLYEAAMIYLPLWDISNGITLCEKCHKTKGTQISKMGGSIYRRTK